MKIISINELITYTVLVQSKPGARSSKLALGRSNGAATYVEW